MKPTIGLSSFNVPGQFVIVLTDEKLLINSGSHMYVAESNWFNLGTIVKGWKFENL